MTFANMFLYNYISQNSTGRSAFDEYTNIEGFCRRAALAASLPLTLQVFTSGVGDGSGLILNQRLLKLALELALLLEDIRNRRRIRGGVGLAKFRHGGFVAAIFAKLESRFRAKRYRGRPWQSNETTKRGCKWFLATDAKEIDNNR